MSTTVKSVTLAPRPYVMHTPGEGDGYPLNSEDAQRLVDSYLAEGGHVTSDARGLTLPTGARIVPATLGGGVAFDVVADVPPHARFALHELERRNA